MSLTRSRLFAVQLNALWSPSLCVSSVWKGRGPPLNFSALRFSKYDGRLWVMFEYFFDHCPRHSRSRFEFEYAR
jgi:hypothetical protein